MKLYTLYGIPTVLTPTYVMTAPLPIITEYLKVGTMHDSRDLSQRIHDECAEATECLISFNRPADGRIGNWVVVPGARLPEPDPVTPDENIGSVPC